MSHSLTVIPVQGRRWFAKFVDLPWGLYKNDPHWVPPIRRDARRTASPAHNPFFRHADVQHFLALDTKGNAVGRVAACIYPAYNQQFNTKAGFFGFLESIQDPAVVKRLLNEAERWLAERGMTSVAGPYNYTPTQDMGLLVDGFDMPPALLQLYNPAFYEEFIQEAGYQRSWSVGTYHGQISELRERLTPLFAESDRLQAACGVTIRTLDRSRLDSERALLLEIFNESFAANRAVVPISEDVFQFQTAAFRHIIDPRIVLFVERAGETLGIGLALPNFNEVLSRTKGRIGLGTLLRWKQTMRAIQSVVVVLLCARPKAHGLGLSRIIAAELVRAGLNAGYQAFYTGWIDEQNFAMKAGLRRLGYTSPEKRYAIYKKDL